MFYEPFINKLLPDRGWIHHYRSNKASKPLYGYKAVSGADSYEQEEFEAGIVRFIFDLLLKKNLPAMEIAKLATEKVFEDSGGKDEHTFYSSTITRIIRHPEYAGHYYKGNELSVSRFHTNPIISLKEWEEAVRIFEHRIESGRGRKSQITHPLSGFMECKECGARYFYKKRPYPANSTLGFFQHGPCKVKKCNPNSTVNASRIEKLTAMLFLKTISNRGYREELIKAFNDYELYTYERYGTAEILYSLNSLQVEISFFWKFVDDIKGRKLFAQHLTEMLIKANSTTKLLIARFNLFTKNVIERWVRNEDADRFMILRTFFDQILVGNGKITFTFETGKMISLDYKNLNDKWKEEIDNLGQRHFPLGHTPNIDDNLDELLSYLEETTACQYYSKEYKVIKEANDLQLGYYRLNQIPYKHYYERADFISVIDTAEKIEGLLIYQENHQGPYIVELNGDKQEVGIELASGSILSLRIAGKQYFNMRYIHRLPEWFYGKNYEYFKIGRRRIIFIREEKRIVAKYLKTRGEPETLSLDDAIAELIKADNLQYVDID